MTKEELKTEISVERRLDRATAHVKWRCTCFWTNQLGSLNGIESKTSANSLASGQILDLLRALGGTKPKYDPVKLFG